MMKALLTGLGFATAMLASQAAHAATLRVPSQYPTIQAAVDAASDGDRIRVAPGEHCGATIGKRVELVGQGRPHIIGCATSPVISGGARAGFFLPGAKGVNPASGTVIRGFVFDGAGISNANLGPLAFGVFARFANDVRVTRNRFVGTVQAITNTGGDRWVIRRNRIRQLTLFDCTRLCTGGDGIIISVARGSLAAPGGDSAAINRPEDNLVARNSIAGTAPDGFSAFSMVGVLMLSADRSTLLANRLRLRDNPNAASVGQGIVVSNTCCGLGVSFLPGSRNTTLAFNDGRQSEVAIVVDGTAGANTEGLFLWKNRGRVLVEGEVAQMASRALRVSEPERAQPTL